ncbi:MAG: hypothetical protein ACQEQV_09770 [Fibrobacterota bacterium]
MNLSWKIVLAFSRDLPMVLFRPAHARVIPDVVRAGNVDLHSSGISIDYPPMPKDLYQHPFCINFSDLLQQFGGVEAQVFNTYVTGKYQRRDGHWFSPFYDPSSLYKDSWFGVYFVMDDSLGQGRSFMLKESGGDPADLNNIDADSLSLLTETDQRCIFFSSHQGMKYTMDDLKKDFCIEKILPFPEYEATDSHSRTWKTVDVNYHTKSALTDTAQIQMTLTDSIRSYCGLPAASLYDVVSPWHPFRMPGRVHGRYFQAPDEKGHSFWAVVYYCGSVFTTRNGTEVNTWDTGSLQMLYEKAFKECRIHSV